MTKYGAFLEACDALATYDDLISALGEPTPDLAELLAESLRGLLASLRMDDPRADGYARALQVTTPQRP